MQSLALLMIVVVTMARFLATGNTTMGSGWLPRYVAYLPEIVALLVLFFVIAYGTRNRFQFVRPAYWLTFGALCVGMICGVLVNAVEPGPMFAGMRTYLRAIPMFFLPAVFYFNEKHTRGQLYLLMTIAAMQVPLALYQRFETRAMGNFTGDWTSGSLLISSILSMFLVSAVCVLTAFYLRKQLRFRNYLLIAILLLIPTTVNETKGTLVLLPIGLLAVFLVGSEPGTRLRNMAVVTGLMAVFGAIFVPVYDHFIADRPYGGTSIGEFMTDRDKVEGYLYKETEVGATGAVGRGDAILVPLRELAKSPPQLVFGLGIGNASVSSLGPRFNGRYAAVYGRFVMHSFSLLTLEFGLLGAFLVLLLYWLILRDSLTVASASNDTKGVLALAWVGITTVIAIGSFYKNLILFESLGYLFWFYSGLIAAERMRLARSRTRAARSRDARAAKSGVDPEQSEFPGRPPVFGRTRS
jgi:cell division protein FtsW (lipid II flippase)